MMTRIDTLRVAPESVQSHPPAGAFRMGERTVYPIPQHGPASRG
jgi:hypothetical protein